MYGLAQVVWVCVNWIRAELWENIQKLHETERMYFSYFFRNVIGWQNNSIAKAHGVLVWKLIVMCFSANPPPICHLPVPSHLWPFPKHLQWLRYCRPYPKPNLKPHHLHRNWRITCTNTTSRAYANSEGTDKTAHPRSLNWALAFRLQYHLKVMNILLYSTVYQIV